MVEKFHNAASYFILSDFYL